jgi:hypothetical protein
MCMNWSLTQSRAERPLYAVAPHHSRILPPTSGGIMGNEQNASRPQGKQRRLYLSTSRNDGETLQPLLKGIALIGHDVWNGEEISADVPRWGEILRSIRECDAMVVALSPHLVSSDAAARERWYAQRLGKPIVPVMVAEMEVMDLPSEFAGLQILDLTNNPLALIQLDKALSELPPAPPLPTPLPSPPEAPISYLLELGHRIRQPRLSYEQQVDLVNTIRSLSGDLENSKEARRLLTTFSERSDLDRRVKDQIDTILDRTHNDPALFEPHAVAGTETPALVEDLQDAEGLADHVGFVPDAPSSIDLLNRQALAKAIVKKLRAVHAGRSETSFLIQIDGPWGSGKSTLISLVRKELEQTWLTVPFNAWREEGIGPPWWSLLTSLRNAYVEHTPWWKRIGVRFLEVAHRTRTSGAPYALALVFLFAMSVAIYNLFDRPRLNLQDIAEMGKAVSVLVAAGTTLWLGSLLASRFLLWDSARGARLFEQSDGNPMQNVSEHFSWIMRRTRRPIVFFIDDLDRCKHSYVVDLLEAVQTLVRDPLRSEVPFSSDRTGRRHPSVYLIVAADGAWIRKSYEKVFEDFSGSVAEPGRPLGYLFTDKLFQLRVSMPSVDPSYGKKYLQALLRGKVQDSPRTAEIAKAVRTVSHYLDTTTSSAEITTIYKSTPLEVRPHLVEKVVDRLTEPEVQKGIEHSLERFSALLSFNPRTTKRFINTYSMLQTVTILEGHVVDPDTLALWTIIETRWPGLADALRKEPDLISPTEPTSETHVTDNAFLDLLGSRAVQEVINFRHGGPLTAEGVRKCCGRHTGSPGS